MGYVDANLIAGEDVVYRANLHWIIFLPGIILCVIVIGVFLLIGALIRRFTTELAVTNKRVIIKTGWLSRKTLEMNLAKIENIAVDQSIIGRLFGYGTIAVVGTGGTREPFHNIANPLEFRKAVQAQSHQ
jgi:uncharacterized membrane protein YdbT with pleckstrin-like domain